MNKQDATTFIAHQAPMIFVEHVVESGEDYAVTEVTIRPELMFCKEQGLPTWASIEIMAQSIAVFAGVQGQKHNQAPQVGYLLGTRKMSLPMPYFKMGAVLRIKVQQLYVHEGLGQFQCDLTYEGECITAILSVYQPDTSKVENKI